MGTQQSNGATETGGRDARAEQALGGELWAQVAPDAARRLLVAAVEAFSAVGFHATTTREIAQRAGMSPAALYVHYPSKAELLSAIIVRGHEDVLEALDRAAARERAPLPRLLELVRVFVAWHARHNVLARVGRDELHDLPPAVQAEVRRMRHRIEQTFEQELERGTRSGELHVPDAHAVMLAIMSLGLDLTRWYAPERHMEPDALAALYVELVRRMVRRNDGARP